MNGGRFDRLRDIVLKAEGLSGSARARYLDEACAGDDELRKSADELLAIAADDVANVRDLAQGGLESWLAASEESEPDDDVFSRYELREEIGRGGSSVVHRAEQLAPVRREVALKVLRSRRLDPLARRRFLGEQQTLATLEHPNIARVFDAGTTPEGQPFFAMELVRGRAITDHARACELHHEESIRLLLQACAGVEHAHRRGVIHRDLKPSNLLVGEHEDRPVVKVIDFGIARPLDRTADPRFTLAGHMLGTPQYMSPEQARDDRDRVDVRSDVFSLGVVLHELLTGAIPYPEHLDTALSLLGAVSRGQLEQRRTDERGRPLPRDLAAILRRALAPDPEARYESCGALSHDLQNYLERRPVVARRGGSVYAFRKLVGRHPLASALLASLLVLIVTSSVVSMVLYQRAEREAENARREAVTATTLADHLQGMIAAAAPTGGDRNVTMSEVLDTSVERAEQDLADQPFVLARVLATIGNVKADLGEGPVAHSLWDRAVELLDGLADPGAEELRWQLAKNAAIAIQIHQDFERMRRDVFALADGVRASDLESHSKAEIVYLAFFRLADAAGVDQRVEEADLYLAVADSCLAHMDGNTEPRRIQLGFVRGRAFAEIGDHARARGLLEEAFQGYRRYLGLEDNRTLVVMNRLAAAESGLGMFERALDRHAHILPTGLELLGEDHVRMGHFHAAHGWTLTRSGRPAAALPEFERAVEVFEINHPPRHQTHSDAHAGRAAALLGLRRYAEARDAYARSLASEESLPSPRPFRLVRFHTGHGVSLHRLGDLEGAARAFDAAFAAVPDRHGREHFTLADTWTALACLHLDRGRPDEALTAAETSIRIEQQAERRDPTLRLFADHARARALWSIGERDSARALLLELEDDLLDSTSHPDVRRHALVGARSVFEALGDSSRVGRHASALRRLDLRSAQHVRTP